MPHVIMGDGKEQTIDKFLTKPLALNEHRFLLIDSDQRMDSLTKQKLVEQIKKRDNKKRLEPSTENVFFMVQEAEAWILSQSEILKRMGLKANITQKCHASEIEKPSMVLFDIYRKSGGQYHKVREFVKVLPMLDTNQLKNEFEEFDSLISALK